MGMARGVTGRGGVPSWSVPPRSRGCGGCWGVRGRGLRGWRRGGRRRRGAAGGPGLAQGAGAGRGPAARGGAGAADLVLVRPAGRPSGEHVRRIGARVRRTARQRGAALVVAGEWPGADLRLRLTEAAWSGLGAGTGHLTGRRVTVAADGRGAAGRER